jgi:hypothetical protein
LEKDREKVISSAGSSLSTIKETTGGFLKECCFFSVNLTCIKNKSKISQKSHLFSLFSKLREITTTIASSSVLQIAGIVFCNNYLWLQGPCPLKIIHNKNGAPAIRAVLSIKGDNNCEIIAPVVRIR